MTDVSIMAGGLRTPEFLGVNPLGQVPALVLDDDEVLTETVAICRSRGCIPNRRCSGPTR